MLHDSIYQVRSVQSLSHVQLFATPRIAARQAPLSITNSQSLLKLMSIESGMPSSHLILCRPLLLLPSIFPSIRVFSSESVFPIRWPKYWSFSFSISPSNEHPGLISFRMDWLDLLAVQGTYEASKSSQTPRNREENGGCPGLGGGGNAELLFSGFKASIRQNDWALETCVMFCL